MITPFIDQTSIQALAGSLVHFLWQGAVLGLIAFALLRVPRLRATTRYVIGISALLAMLASPIATFLYLNRSVSETSAVEPVEARVISSPSAATAESVDSPAEARSPHVVEAPMPAMSRTSAGPFVILAIWLSGVVLLSLRLLGGWIVARRLITRAVRPVSPEIHSLARRVAGRLALDRVVRVLESTAVSVPVMVGWIKPVVLLPAAALSGLTPTQVEALIAHELAHIRRHDYLVNLLQSAVETLLFYHPAVWWISARVRAEREHCCDDLAVGVCDRLVYVTALADLAAMTTTPSVALAATDGSLVNRVRRLLGRSRDRQDPASSWMPALMLILAVSAMLPAAFVVARGQEGSAGNRNLRSVSGEIAQGVAAGVTGGVPAGVAGGVDLLLLPGVPGGVARGVAGGVAGGVVGGVSGGLDSTPYEALQDDAAIKAAVADPAQWRLMRDPAGRWRLVNPNLPIRPWALRWRLYSDAQGNLLIAREGQVRASRDPEVEQAEAALRERIAALQAELAELKKHYEEIQREYAAKLHYALPLHDSLVSAKALEQLRLAQESMLDPARLEQHKLLLDSGKLNELLATEHYKRFEQDQKAMELLKGQHQKLFEQDLLRQYEVSKKLFADQALFSKEAFDKQQFEFAAAAEAFEKSKEELTAPGGKSLSFQSSSAQGSGSFSWSNNGDRVSIKWTGPFRISDDDKDIVWVEPGKMVQVSNGARVFSTAVEVKGLADGKVERIYYRNSVSRQYEPEGREFLAGMLQKVVRVSGFGAEDRVARFLKQGGVPAVLAEIELMQGDYARRLYYRELLKQAKVTPAELSKLMGRASETIKSDYELASLVASATAQAKGNEAALVAVVDATKTIESDYEMRRALTAAMADPVTPKIASSVLTSAGTIASDYERATLLIELAKKGGLTSATKAPFFELVKTIRSSHEQGRVLRSVAAMPTLPEDVLAEAVKASQAMSGDYERRQFLSQSIARQPVTSKSANDVIQSASGIRSDNEQATLLVDLARRGGVTDETAAGFFPIVATMTASYEQRRVLMAVLAGPAQLSEGVMTGLLKAAASIGNAFERAEVLVAAVRKQALSPAARSLYLAAADTIRSEHEQTRVYAELVRAERGVRK
jgi:beta-lactamase regulating signal transducer with metallopeptidase domain